MSDKQLKIEGMKKSQLIKKAETIVGKISDMPSMGGTELQGAGRLIQKYIKRIQQSK